MVLSIWVNYVKVILQECLQQMCQLNWYVLECHQSLQVISLDCKLLPLQKVVENFASRNTLFTLRNKSFPLRSTTY